MIKKLCLLLSVAFCLLYASDATAVDLLTISRSSASMARGGTFLADNQRQDLIFHNFAYLGSNQKVAGSFMSGKVFNEIAYNTFSVMFKNLSFGFFGISESAGFVRDEKNNRQSEIIHSDINIYLATGVDFSFLNFGVRLRNIKKNFSVIESSAGALLLDLAAYCQVFDNLALGLQFNNFSGSKLKWTSGREENLSANLGFGLRWRALTNTNLLADILVDDAGAVLNLGGEYTVSELLILRVGLNQEQGAQTAVSTTSFTSFTFGLGLNIGDFFFDYAYYLSGILNDNSTHYFTISYQFEPVAVSPQVVEEVINLQEKIDQDIKNISDYSDNFQVINQDVSSNIGNTSENIFEDVKDEIIEDVSSNEQQEKKEIVEEIVSLNENEYNLWEERKVEPKEKEKLLEQDQPVNDFWE